ncbi:hypothetical protein [Streptosporangium sp. NPDC087985]|uniref:hypothetical protein n=1 Tax=Streptosporangium sp. NPDC087985 TaxID=3366196 RepID=UPI0038029573
MRRNTVLHYGKDGALTGPDKDHAETSMLALHLRRSALVYTSTRCCFSRSSPSQGPARPDRAVLVQRRPAAGALVRRWRDASKSSGRRTT